MRRYGDTLILTAISILAVWPFLVNPSLPQGTDAELHIYRLAELSRLVRAGEFYPRWSPNFYFGYGYPIFNYYAPLSYYVGLLFDFLPVVQPVGATKAVFVLGLFLGGLGTFGFVRDLWGREAGWVAAAVYLYAPYVQYIDPHARGVLAETFSLGVWPMALWAFGRLRRQPTRWNWAAAVAGMAAIVLTHNLMAMVWAGVLAGWLLWGFVVSRGAGEQGGRGEIGSPTPLLPRSPAPLLFSAYLLGIGLAAFFWLPVGLERNAINVTSVVGEVGSHFDFRQHFLSVGELLSPSLWLDWGASEPAYRFNLGIAQWVLGGLGMAFAVWRAIRREWEHAAEPLFYAVAALLLVGLMLPISTAVWETIPLLPFIQFPWRLLGPAASLLAILAGYAIYEMSQWTAKAVTTNVALAFTLLLAFPLTQPPPWPNDFGETSVAQVAYLETRGRWLGTTSTADFVPATVDVLPPPNQAMMDSLLANQTPNRINAWSVESVGATAEWEQISPLHMRYHIETPQEFTFRLFLFAFPGWEVRLDGGVVETDIGRPEGFLVVPVPAGVHVVDVAFVDTPSRTWGWGIAAVSLLLILLVAWRLPLTAKAATTNQSAIPNGPRPPSPQSAILLIWLLFLPLHFTGWLHYESPPTAVLIAQTQLAADFGAQIWLQGADMPEVLRHEEPLALTLYWRPQRPLDINYQAFVHILDENGQLVAQGDKLNPGEFPTRRWEPAKYVRDEYEIALPAQLPAGRYRAAVGLWVAAEGWRLPVLDPSGQHLGDFFVIGEWVVP